MSSLKGQLANVEGSVKSMKMAVVVGSVLTVACLAAVFGVTILANEVSKETKVSNGSLVDRQGENVITATRQSITGLSEDLSAGDVLVSELVGGSGSVECIVQKAVRQDGQIIAACNDAVFMTMGSGVKVIAQEDSLFVDAIVDPEHISAEEAERKLSNPVLLVLKVSRAYVLAFPCDSVRCLT